VKIEGFTQFLDKHLAESRVAGPQRATRVFVPDGETVSESDIKKVESDLGVSLPRSYRQFLLTCGPGLWCDDYIPHPRNLYAFDEDCWEIAGFVPLIHNVLGCGDHVAINPSEPDQDGERPLYYCTHDPFGYAQVATSFEEWCRKAVDVQGTDATVYDDVGDEVRAKWKEYLASQPKKWWQFWR
jgi:hypothetical protein